CSMLKYVRDNRSCQVSSSESHMAHRNPRKKCTGGEHISHAAQEHLLCRGWFAGETDHLQAAQHQARRRSAKNGEKREALRRDDRKSRQAQCCVKLVQRELSYQ